MVRAWSAMARVIACRIHQGRIGRELCTPSAIFELGRRPSSGRLLPSWMRSRNCRPRWCISWRSRRRARRLASINSRLACSASMSPWIISRWVRLISPSGTPVSSSILFEIDLAVLLLAPVLLLELFRLATGRNFWLSRVRIWRSSVRMESTVLVTLSRSRLRSGEVYLNSRTMRET